MIILVANAAVVYNKIPILVLKKGINKNHMSILHERHWG